MNGAPDKGSFRQAQTRPDPRRGQHSASSAALHAAAPDQSGSSLQLEPRSRDRRASAARRNTLFVTLMKGVLPVIAVGFLAVLVFYSQGGFAPDLPENVTFDPGKLDLEGSGIKMLNPKLSGLDDNNQRFEVNARSAVQDRENPGHVTLDGIQARMVLQDGGWVNVQANGGEFRSEESRLTLVDDIEVTMSSGYVAKLNGADVDFKNGSLVTTNPVLVFMNAGIISANAMEILEKGARVRFTERATMTINGDPADLAQELGQ